MPSQSKSRLSMRLKALLLLIVDLVGFFQFSESEKKTEQIMLFLFSQGVIFTKWKVIWTPDQGSLRNWHSLWLTIATSSSQGGQLIMKASSFWFWSWLASWGQKWELKNLQTLQRRCEPPCGQRSPFQCSLGFEQKASRAQRFDLVERTSRPGPIDFFPSSWNALSSLSHLNTSRPCLCTTLPPPLFWCCALT